MEITTTELLKYINNISAYLQKQGKPVLFYEIESKFLNNLELPEHFEYFNYDIETLIFKGRLGDLELKKKFLISTKTLYPIFYDILSYLIKVSKGEWYFNNQEIKEKLINYLFSEYSELSNFDIDLKSKVIRYLEKSKDFLRIMKDTYNFSIINYKIAPERLLPVIASLIRKLEKTDIPSLINNLKIEYGISLDEMDIDSFNIEKFLKENNHRFKVVQNNYITLTEDIEFFKEYFYNINNILTIEELISIYSNRTSSEGIFALIFTGKKFPIKKMDEYIKLRPIIGIDLTHSVAQVFNEELKTEDYEIIENLYAILSDIDVDVADWLRENTKVSFYEEEVEGLKIILPRIIQSFSPILNLKYNPGNLFRYTIQEKLNKYRSNNLINY